MSSGQLGLQALGMMCLVTGSRRSTRIRVSGRYPHPVTVNLGDLPGWIEAVATVGALGAATLAVLAANKTNKQQASQIGQLEKAEADRVAKEEREQANTIAVWIALDGARFPRLYFSNSSHLPVYHVAVIIKAPWGHTLSQHAVLGPTSEPVNLQEALRTLTIASQGAILYSPVNGECVIDDTAILPTGVNDWNGLVHHDHISAGLAFFDVNGVEWFRSPGGYLTRTSADDDPGVGLAMLAEAMQVSIER